ncbi:MAG: hypothetical protein B7Y39_06205 [Bdellovibrio sp. 28-41-41]|nr:MAG: hypothetical protein B7Y39_06205 [Bdellovibrio sp. 28-41-41]
MKTMMLVLLFLAGAAQAQSRYGYAYYGSPQMRWSLPANNLHMQDTGRPTNITEQRFGQIIDEVMAVWTPVAAAKGIKLTVEKRWSDPTVNASASQSGKTWMVNMYGGLARRPEVTDDGFALVVCHELGHHFGGYSFYGRTDWASAEGESDFFATNVCAKYIWGKQQNRNGLYRRLRETPPVVQKACETVWNGNANAQAWCVRTALGGHSLATLLHTIGGRDAAPAPSFDTPDKSVVTKTSVSHPKAQCRLDTYFSGALCTAKWDLNVIPAKKFSGGQDTPQAEQEAMKYSCFTAGGSSVGVRPLCWFKPLNSGFRRF